MSDPITVLVVEDSAFMQRRIVELLESCPEIKVTALARDGQDAIDKLERLSPHVITMDINMPRMDGLTAIERIMSTRPRPILIFSSYTKSCGEVGIKALELGAIDIVEKPGDSISLDLDGVRDELIRKVKTAARVRVVRNAGRAACASMKSKVAIQDRPIMDEPNPSRAGVEPRGANGIVCIGSSTGGPNALCEILPALPADFPFPIALAQHMPGNFMRPFVQQLASKCKLRVKEAEDRETLRGSTVYVSPGFHHLEVGREGKAALIAADVLAGPCPSVDALFRSAASAYGALATGVLLTGMGNDGAEGLSQIRRGGGHTIAQDEESCVVFGMPKAAIDRGSAKEVLSSRRIAESVSRVARWLATSGGNP